MRRVQEMHSHTYTNARRKAVQTEPEPSEQNRGEAPETPLPTEHKEEHNTYAQPVRAPKENRAAVQNNTAETGGSLLETVFHDKERSLILLLILILTNESTKPEALLALMYLII